MQPTKHHRDITISHVCNLLLFQAIVNVVLSSGCVGPNIKFNLCYGLLLKHLKSSEIHWLHPDLTVSELTQRYEQQHLEAEWRLVLVYIHTVICIICCSFTLRNTVKARIPVLCLIQCLNYTVQANITLLSGLL